MSSKNCSACNDLREYAPGFVQNGTTDAVCTKLSQNKGLSGYDGHDDCDDLHDVNDCLIGNMDDELDSFEICEWPDFMHQLIPNMYETFKTLICSTCGQWGEIDDIKEALCKLTSTAYLELPMTQTSKVGDNASQTVRNHWIGIAYYYTPNMCSSGKMVSYAPYWYGKTYNNVSNGDVVATIPVSQAQAVLGATVIQGIADKTVTYQSGAIGSNKILFHRLEVNNNQLQILYVGSTEYAANYTFSHITPTRIVYNIGYFGNSN